MHNNMQGHRATGLTLSRIHDGHERLVDARDGHHDAEEVYLAATHPHHEAHESHVLEDALRPAI